VSEIKSFRDLLAWQKAMDLVDAVYEATEHFPPSERFGLAQQMRNAAVSIPSNIAEGTRHTRPGYRHHVRIALGSHGELDTQWEVATRRNYFSEKRRQLLRDLLDEVGRLTHGLRRSLE